MLCRSVDRTSTAPTQSSCSNDATCNGGMRARTYSTDRVVSAEMPLELRYSSIEVRRYCPMDSFRRNLDYDWICSGCAGQLNIDPENWSSSLPLTRNSRGTGLSLLRRLLTSVESAYLRKDVGTKMGARSGTLSCSSLVLSCSRT